MTTRATSTPPSPESPRNAMGVVVQLGGIGAVAALLAACGAPGQGEPGELTMLDGEVALSCGAGDPFPVTALTERAEASDPAAVQGVLETLVAEAGIDAPPPLAADPTDWFVQRETGDGLLLAAGDWDGTGPASQDAVVLTLEADGDGYQVTSWSQCQPSPVLTDQWLFWADLGAPGLSDQGGNDLAEVTLQVMERSCTGARDPGPYLREPTVVETDESVTVYWPSGYFEGDPPADAEGMAWTCPGNPVVERTITLREPLGDRQLLDGSRWPATDVRGVDIGW